MTAIRDKMVNQTDSALQQFSLTWGGGPVFVFMSYGNMSQLLTRIRHGEKFLGVAARQALPLLNILSHLPSGHWPAMPATPP